MTNIYNMTNFDFLYVYYAPYPWSLISAIWNWTEHRAGAELDNVYTDLEDMGHVTSHSIVVPSSTRALVTSVLSLAADATDRPRWGEAGRRGGGAHNQVITENIHNQYKHNDREPKCLSDESWISWDG